MQFTILLGTEPTSTPSMQRMPRVQACHRSFRYQRYQGIALGSSPKSAILPSMRWNPAIRSAIISQGPAMTFEKLETGMRHVLKRPRKSGSIDSHDWYQYGEAVSLDNSMYCKIAMASRLKEKTVIHVLNAQLLHLPVTELPAV